MIVFESATKENIEDIKALELKVSILQKMVESQSRFIETIAGKVDAIKPPDTMMNEVFKRLCNLEKKCLVRNL